MKGQKKSASVGRSQKRKTSETKNRRDYVDRRGKTPVGESRIYNERQHQDSTFRSAEHREYQKLTCPSPSKVPSFQSHVDPWDPPRIHHQSHIRSHHRSAPYPILRHDRSSSSTMMRLPLRTSADTFVMSAPHFEQFDQNIHTNHASANPGYNFELRNWSGCSGPDVRRPLHPLVLGTKSYRQRK